MSVAQMIEENVEESAVALPPNLAYESPEEETTEAAAAEPEVDWKAKAEEAEKARNGILRDLQDERRANRERDAKLEELRLAIVERTAGEIEEPAPPSKDDPVAYLDHRIGELQRRLDTLGTMTVEQQQTAAQSAEQERMQKAAQGLATAINESARRKAQETPDYPDAVNHAIGLLKDHLVAQGYSGENLDRAVATELYGLAAGALRSGKDPATVIYEASKRFGYQPKAPSATETVKKGQQAARSLSNVSGSSRGGGKIKIADFLELPDSEQRKIALNPEKWEQLNRTGEVYL